MPSYSDLFPFQVFFHRATLETRSLYIFLDPTSSSALHVSCLQSTIYRTAEPRYPTVQLHIRFEFSKAADNIVRHLSVFLWYTDSYRLWYSHRERCTAALSRRSYLWGRFWLHRRRCGKRFFASKDHRKASRHYCYEAQLHDHRKVSSVRDQESENERHDHESSHGGWQNPYWHIDSLLYASRRVHEGWRVYQVPRGADTGAYALKYDHCIISAQVVLRCLLLQQNDAI